MKSKVFYRREPLVVRLEYDESTVTFYGQDLGGNPNAKEYEYWLTVASEDLRQALDGTNGDQDIGALVCAHAEEIMSVGEMSWLREHGVMYKFHSWIGSDDGDDALPPAYSWAPTDDDPVVADGSELDEKSNYPLSAVPDSIEPGAMMFTLWTDPTNGDPVPYDFGFYWDGEHAADWGCDRGDQLAPGSPSCSGTVSWPNEDEQEDEENDLEVSYTSSSSSGDVSGRTVLPGAGLGNPIRRDEWGRTGGNTPRLPAGQGIGVTHR
jgi:hypothetical protein